MLLDDKGGMDELGMEGRYWVTLPCYLNNRDGYTDIMIDPASDVEKNRVPKRPNRTSHSFQSTLNDDLSWTFKLPLMYEVRGTSTCPRVAPCKLKG